MGPVKIAGKVWDRVLIDSGANVSVVAYRTLPDNVFVTGEARVDGISEGTVYCKTTTLPFEVAGVRQLQ